MNTTADIETIQRDADEGDAEAQYQLFLEYSLAEGDVPVDGREAAKWCRRAAENGHAQAQFCLGQLYRDTNGVPQNYLEAHKWFNLAAVADSEFAETAVVYRNELEEKLTPELIVEAQRMAAEFKPANVPNW